MVMNGLHLLIQEQISSQAVQHVRYPSITIRRHDNLFSKDLINKAKSTFLLFESCLFRLAYIF